jgi:hypothetical protein
MPSLYNTILLSRVYEQKQAASDEEAVAVMKGVSPVAWQHVNLIGKFEFTPATSKVNIEALAARYDDPSCWHKAFHDEAEDGLKS